MRCSKHHSITLSARARYCQTIPKSTYLDRHPAAVRLVGMVRSHMLVDVKLQRFSGAVFRALFIILVFLAAFIPSPGTAQTGEPIKIGYSMALTGGLAANGKSALLAQKIWEEDVNVRGGLLGRPVKLIYYDDQSNPSTVPGIYTKLLEVDKVDLVVGGYATNMVAPALPVMMQKKKLFIGLLALAVNKHFDDLLYFSVTPTGGPKPEASFSEVFFDIAMQQTPKPQTLAVVGADAEFPRNASDGVRSV